MTRRTDQRGVVRDFLYDKLGRLSDDCATSLGGSGVVNATVRRISRAYEVRGMVNKISSYDNASVGSGNLVNQVQLDYNEFTQLITEWQAHTSAGVSGSTPKVQYAYANGGSSSNQIRLTSITYPNARVISYDYGSSTDDDRLSRVTNIKDGLTALAGYTYLGARTVIRIDNTQPGVRLDLWGGTSGTFSGIDLFGRVTDQRWVTTGGSPTYKDRYIYGYDRNSNRQWRQNTVGSSLDEYYTYDNLNRLTEMQRGTLTGSPFSGISGTPVAEQDWTLDPTGNWNGFVVKVSGSTTLNQSRTQNKVNEIVTIGASVGTDWADPVYDAAGNMTSMPKPSSLANSYTATYDAWNRMIQVKDGGTTVATYSYDGRNRRIKVDTGVVRHFYFTNSWQDVEQRLGSLTSADQQYVWGIRYIDELVCRDRLVGSGSSSSSSSSSGGAGLNERLYATQDANFNVTSLIDTSANVAERYNYDPYGTPTFKNGSWADIGTSAKASTILYGGYKYDPETGLYCVRNRFLHATLGGWGRRDPAQYINGANIYQYVVGQPNNLVDPSGRDLKSDMADMYNTTNVNCLKWAVPSVNFGGLDVGYLGLQDEDAFDDYVKANGGQAVAVLFEKVLRAHKADWYVPLGDEACKPCKDGYYKVAMYLRLNLAPGGYDFHFATQSSDGSWSEKAGFAGNAQGMGKLTCKDMRSQWYLFMLTKFLGFYCIRGTPRTSAGDISDYQMQLAGERPMRSGGQ